MPWMDPTTSSASGGINCVAARSRAVLKDPWRRLPEMPITFVISGDDNVYAPLADNLRFRSSPMHDPRRTLSFPSWLNARDLGGYPTSDGQTTRWRSVLRADDPAQLTPAGLQVLAEFAVATVVDLRWPEEIQLSPNPI